MKTFKEFIKEQAEEVKGWKDCGYNDLTYRRRANLMRLNYIAYKHYKHGLKEFDKEFYRECGIERSSNKEIRLRYRDIVAINECLESWSKEK